MSKFENKQYLIDKPVRSPVFLDAWQMAGRQLQKQFTLFNKEEVLSSFDGFKWIQTELTYPSFHDLSFAYRSSIFSIVIELIDGARTSLNRQKKLRLMTYSKANNLIPCLFKVNLQKKETNIQRDVLNNSNQDEYELEASESDWNLFNAMNNQKLDPLAVATDEPTSMSKWELSNFAVQIVRDEIEKQGNQVFSYCDLLEINPQIWFKDKQGNLAWVVVKHVTLDSDLDYREWVGLERHNSVLLPHDGYYAAVQFYSQINNSKNILNRGEGVIVDYKGLKRIYVS